MSIKWISQYKSIFGIYNLPPLGKLNSHICRPSETQMWGEGGWNVLPKIRDSYCDRKFWEFAYIAQALFERGLLEKGKKGLGFACGTEPLPSLFSKHGCRITATDAPFDNANWSLSGEHSSQKNDLYHSSIVDQAVFDMNVDFQYADMNDIPESLNGYDFLWSSCALEHLGSIHNSKDFIFRAMKCLKPGGIAVHTTEINLRSSIETLMTGSAVALRTIDFIEIAEHLTWKGHRVEPLDFRLDGSELYSDFAEFAPNGEPPNKPHLTLKLGRNLVTSFGLIIQKGGVAD